MLHVCVFRHTSSATSLILRTLFLRFDRSVRDYCGRRYELVRFARIAGLAFGALLAVMALPPTAVFAVTQTDVPIIFNDRHVDASPDILRNDRVLGALVKDGVVLIPLRAMFERMGATVAYDASSKRVDISRGTEARISLTVGVPEISVNGETRPLDVPPMMYKGVLVVPVRVISEGLGAYVEWLPSQRLVVVRYAPPTPVPAPIATPTPAPVPTPAMTPQPVRASQYAGYIQAALTGWGKVYNEFKNGPYCREGSYVGSVLYRPINDVAIKVDTRQDRYVTTTGFTDALGNQFTVFHTIDGGVAAVPVFKAQQNTFDVRLEYRVADPNLYVGAAYLRSSNSYGYPRLGSVGFGVEKLPDFMSSWSPYASAYYYPSASGTYTVEATNSPNFGVSYKQQYSVLKYDLGIAWQFSGNAPVYAYGGFSGDRFTVKENAPIGQTHSGFYAGLGLRL